MSCYRDLKSLARATQPDGVTMYVSVAKIQELIDICKEVDDKQYEDDWDKRIHVRDIAGTLQKLIDDELDALDKMAKEFDEIPIQ